MHLGMIRHCLFVMITGPWMVISACDWFSSTNKHGTVFTGHLALICFLDELLDNILDFHNYI